MNITPENSEKNYVNGKIITLTNLTSHSKDESVSQRFMSGNKGAKIMLVIDSTKGRDMSIISDVSEKEVVYMPGDKFEITSYKMRKIGSDIVKYVYAKEV